MVKSKAQEKVAKIRNKPKTSKRMQFPIKPINVIIIVSLAIAVWIGYKGYRETRVNTPYNGKKACIIYHQVIPYNLVYLIDIVEMSLECTIFNNFCL